MCGCPLHDNHNAVDICSCVCEQHDQFFESGLVVLRKAVRARAAEIYRLQQDMGQAMTAIKKIEERLSPPDKVAKAPRVEDIAAFAEGRDVPPDMWDRFGVRWSAKRYRRVPGRTTDDIVWEAHVPDERRPGFTRIAMVPGEDLEMARGPFTETSPLAEDQEPDPNAGKDTDPVNPDHEPYIRQLEADNAALRRRLSDWADAVPEQTGETDGELLARLGTDAAKWAAEAVQVLRRQFGAASEYINWSEVEHTLLGWFASAICAGESKNAVALDYLRHLVGENWGELSQEWFENYYGSDTSEGPGVLKRLEEQTQKIEDAYIHLRRLRLEFWGADESGTPIWERPITEDENGVDWKMRATAAETELAIAREEEEPEPLLGVVMPEPSPICYEPIGSMKIGSLCSRCGHHAMAHADSGGPCLMCALDAKMRA